jgi:hypothetical protein
MLSIESFDIENNAAPHREENSSSRITIATEGGGENVLVYHNLDKHGKRKIGIENNRSFRLVIFWDAANTLTVRLLGKERGAKFCKVIAGTRFRLFSFSFITITSGLITLLCLFGVLPSIVAIIFASLYGILFLIGFSNFVDLWIARTILDIRSGSFIVLSILRGVALCMICSWNASSIAFLIVSTLAAILMVSLDAFPKELRQKNFKVSAIALFIMLLSQAVVVNLGLIPNQLQNATFFVLASDIAKIPFIVSCYSVFNDSIVASLTLLAEDLYMRSREPGKLRVMAVHYMGDDAHHNFDYPTFSYM